MLRGEGEDVSQGEGMVLPVLHDIVKALTQRFEDHAVVHATPRFQIERLEEPHAQTPPPLVAFRQNIPQDVRLDPGRFVVPPRRSNDFYRHHLPSCQVPALHHASERSRAQIPLHAVPIAEHRPTRTPEMALGVAGLRSRPSTPLSPPLSSLPSTTPRRQGGVVAHHVLTPGGTRAADISSPSPSPRGAPQFASSPRGRGGGGGGGEGRHIAPPPGWGGTPTLPFLGIFPVDNFAATAWETAVVVVVGREASS